MMNVPQLLAAGFEYHGQYSKRLTAEIVADHLQHEGYDTAIRDQVTKNGIFTGEHLVYRRRPNVLPISKSSHSYQ